MPTSYILVNCTLGSEEKIISEIAKLLDVKEVRGTYGVHDIFVKVKSDNTEAMNHTITNKIRKIPGITSTGTLVVIEEQGGKWVNTYASFFCHFSPLVFLFYTLYFI